MNSNALLQPIAEALREARQALSDADWEGRATEQLIDRVRHLEEMQKRGETLAPRF